MRIIDSVNDKNILKAVFLAGGPGVWKSLLWQTRCLGFKDQFHLSV